MKVADINLGVFPRDKSYSFHYFEQFKGNVSLSHMIAALRKVSTLNDNKSFYTIYLNLLTKLWFVSIKLEKVLSRMF